MSEIRYPPQRLNTADNFNFLVYQNHSSSSSSEGTNEHVGTNILSDDFPFRRNLLYNPMESINISRHQRIPRFRIPNSNLLSVTPFEENMIVNETSDEDEENIGNIRNIGSVGNIGDMIPFQEYYYTDIMQVPVFDSEENKDKYGKAAIETFKKLFDGNLIVLSLVNDSIYRKIADAYYHICERESKIDQKFTKTTRYVKCLPKLKHIKRFAASKNFNDSKNFRNVYFFKICFDLTEDYLKKIDKPLFETYSRKFLPTAIHFYSRLSEDNFTKILVEIKSSPIMFYNKHHNILWNQEDLISSYKKERKDLLNLNGGLTLNSKKFIQ